MRSRESLPLNVWDLKRDIVYKNDEMYNLMRALDIEDNIEHLRCRSKFIARQRRRVGDLGENVAEVFGAATFGALQDEVGSHNFNCVK